MDTRQHELRDIPFMGNDMYEALPTTGKPLDSVDGAGKADAELGAPQDQPDSPAPEKGGKRKKYLPGDHPDPDAEINPDDAQIEEPRDDVFDDEDSSQRT